jgi:ABC-type sugar transport system ATPase subunit
MTNAPATSRLSLTNVTKSFSGVAVLKGVSLALEPGQVLGLVGENGAGKSTTMNIVSGVFAPDGGAMTLDGAAYAPMTRRESEARGVAFVQQELNIFPNLSIAENILLSRLPRLDRRLPFTSKSALRKRARALLDQVHLDVDPDASAAALSPGERQLAEIARSLAGDLRLLILDEPTTSLTQREIRILFGIIETLKARGVSIVFISHILEDVLHLADKIVVMRDGQVTLDSPRAHLSASDLVTAMVGRSVEALFPSRAMQDPGAPVLEVAHVSEPGVAEDISLDVRRGEIVGLAGLMGSGRTELARILFGLDPHRSGTIRMNGVELHAGDVAARLKAGIAFLTEDRRGEGMLMNASIADNMALAALPKFSEVGTGVIQSAPLAARIKDVAETFRLKGGALERAPVRTLSGGNQQKVVLARWLLRKPKLFILDEPTRGVDIGAKEEIYSLLAQLANEGMALLIVSSEIDELIGLCDRILIMRHGRVETSINRADFDVTRILQAAFGQNTEAAS